MNSGSPAMRLLSVAFWVLTISYVVAVVLSGWLQPVGTFDEPIPWVSALQIRRGVTPHTGFWSTYPPLTYSLLAGVFALLGETAVAARSLGIVFFLLLLTFVGALTRRDFPQAGWRIPAAVLFAALGAGPLFVYAFGVPLAASLCTLLVYFILSRAPAASSPMFALIPGLMLAVTVLLRINFGVYCALTILLDLTLVGEKKRALFVVGPMLLAFLAYLLPYQAGMGEVIHQIVVVPQRVLARTRFIPLLNDPIYYAALALPLAWFSLRMLALGGLKPGSFLPLPAAAAVCAIAYLSHDNSAVLPGVSLLNVAGVVLFDRYLFHLGRSERGILIMYAMFTHYFLWRADEWHLRPLLTLTGLLLPYLLYSWTASPLRAWARIPAVFLTLALLPLIAELFWKLHSFRPDSAAIRSTLELIRTRQLMDGVSDSARLLGVADTVRPEWRRLYPDSAELSALRYVSAHTRQSDCVYVGLFHHTNVFVSDIRAYWLLHRCIGVRMFILDPGVTTEVSAQAEMAADLQRKHVRWVVLTPAVQGDAAFLRNPIRGAVLLDAAIAQRYRIAATFGEYAVLTESRRIEKFGSPKPTLEETGKEWRR